MNDNFVIASSPHMRSKIKVSSIMIYIIIGLLPATILGVYTYGLSALIVVLVTTGTTVLIEYLYEKICKKNVTIGDFHSTLCGLLLALNLPANTPWWICVIGGVFAVLVLKPIKIVNSVLGAKVLVWILFSNMMKLPLLPLEQVIQGEQVELFNMMLGNTSGSIGTSSMIAILIGAAFLIIMEVVDIRIPVTYILSFVVFIILFSNRGLDVNFLVAQLCGESLMMGAWFMATDYVTSPITVSGKIIYGIFLGLLTGFLRINCGMNDGVPIAILTANLLVPVLEWITKPRKRN